VGSGGDRANYDAALADLSVTEEFHGLSRPGFDGGIEGSAVAGDAGTSLSLAHADHAGP